MSEVVSMPESLKDDDGRVAAYRCRKCKRHDFLSDDLCEDQEMEGDWQAFDKLVNDWIKEHFPGACTANGDRITESIKSKTGFTADPEGKSEDE